MKKRQVFLGGACGASTWRRIAIPLLEAAGVTYHDPQLQIGQWSAACEASDLAAKSAADVLLFVVNGDSRGVASIGEIAYYLGARRPLALVVSDIAETGIVDGSTLSRSERDDLNRGRLLVRSMAREHAVPVFDDVAAATHHAISLVTGGAGRLRAVLQQVAFKPGEFAVEQVVGGFLIQPCWEEADIHTGEKKLFRGRKWYVDASATETEIVRTAFEAALAWQEHEARERFTYQGRRVFDPHS